MVSCLVEGMSIALTVEMTGVSKNTIVKLLVDLGVACSQYLDRSLRNLPCRVVECDDLVVRLPEDQAVPINHEGEFGFGDVWTWTALDADKTRPVVACRPATTGIASPSCSTCDHESPRGPAQLTTNARSSYLSAMEPLFNADRSHYAMLIEMFGGDVHDLRRSPPAHTGITREILTGVPDSERISTSYLERTGLTTRIWGPPAHQRYGRLQKEGGKPRGGYLASLHGSQFHAAACDPLQDPRIGQSDHPSHGR